MQQFFKALACKLVVYDPLDRPIKGLNQNDEWVTQSTTRKELLEKIGNLTPINGRELSLPLSDIMMKQFDLIIKDSTNAIVAEGEAYLYNLKENKDYGQLFTQNLKVQ